MRNTGSTIDIITGSRQMRQERVLAEARRAGRNRHRRAVVRDERIVLGATLVLTAMLVIGFFLTGSVRTEAAPSEIRSKYYTSIRIEQGDTLWGLADRYMTDEYKDREAYIREVCEMNRISEDDIHAGQYLTIPYYAAEPLMDGSRQTQLDLAAGNIESNIE